MRIERISDTQMKFVLMHTDLMERDIKISELSHSSDKTQQLFKEVLQIAQDEGSFVSPDNAPYLIEATKIGIDGLSVVVTRMSPEDLDQRFSLVPAAKDRCQYKRNKYIDQVVYPGDESFSVFSFQGIDTAASAAGAIDPIFEGESRLYKLNGQYFLWLQNNTQDDRPTASLEAIMQEFGEKHASTPISREYFAEHGEVIISDNAISKLAGYAVSC